MIAETGRWWAVGGGYGRLLRLCVPRRHTNTNPEAAPASRTDVLEAGTVRFWRRNTWKCILYYAIFCFHPHIILNWNNTHSTVDLLNIAMVYQTVQLLPPSPPNFNVGKISVSPHMQIQNKKFNRRKHYHQHWNLGEGGCIPKSVVFKFIAILNRPTVVLRGCLPPSKTEIARIGSNKVVSA